MDRSICCNARVKVLRDDPLLGSKEIFYFTCVECKKPCHLKKQVKVVRKVVQDVG